MNSGQLTYDVVLRVAFGGLGSNGLSVVVESGFGFLRAVRRTNGGELVSACRRGTIGDLQLEFGARIP